MSAKAENAVWNIASSRNWGWEEIARLFLDYIEQEPDDKQFLLWLYNRFYTNKEEQE